LAFSDGRLAETGETINVEKYQLDVIEPRSRARMHCKAETTTEENSSAASNRPSFTSEDAVSLLTPLGGQNVHKVVKFSCGNEPRLHEAVESFLEAAPGNAEIASRRDIFGQAGIERA
jgi:hypothetical protein